MKIKTPTLKTGRCLSALFFYVTFIFAGMAQEFQAPAPSGKEEPVQAHSFNTLGGVISGSGGTVSQSVGQLVYSMDESAGGSLSQGVQRPYRLASVEMTASAPALNFTVLPNPTDGNLLLRLSDKPEENPLYQVTDLQGRELLQGRVSYPDTPVQLSGFASGTYLIRIQSTQNKPLQTLQIIKN